jgi:transketolase
MVVYDNETIESLETRANKIRQHIVSMIFEAGSGHPGGSLSMADIITAVYFGVLKHNPENPKMEDRDRFVLSKGHGAPALYAALSEAGYFPVEELKTLRKLGSNLQGHPDMRKTPGVEMSTGSLGQGISVAVGMALAAKLDRKLYKIYCILGDGETNEGEVWEAAMAAAHYKLDNLIGILDRNMLQIDGATEQIMGIEPLASKWKAFGWHVIEINGHSFREILGAITQAQDIKGQPIMILAHTTKGKGVSFMEGAVGFHGKAPNKEEYDMAIKELKQEAKDISKRWTNLRSEEKKREGRSGQNSSSD